MPMKYHGLLKIRKSTERLSGKGESSSMPKSLPNFVPKDQAVRSLPSSTGLEGSSLSDQHSRREESLQRDCPQQNKIFKYPVCKSEQMTSDVRDHLILNT